MRWTSSASHMPDFVRHIVECRMPIDFRQSRLEQLVLVRWIGGGDGGRWHDPDRIALAAPRIDVARRLQRHLGIRGMNRTTMLMCKARVRADEYFPKRQRLLAHAIHSAAILMASRRALHFCAKANSCCHSDA